MIISFVLDGESRTLEVDGGLRAVDVLREHCGVTGPKEGCGTGECGACAVLVDGVTRLSCLMLAAQLEGHSVTTAQGLDKDGVHPVQKSLVELGGVQCGYCTPGMAVTSAEFLERHPDPSREEIREALSGNLCRCTGYHKIIDAVEDAAKRLQKECKVQR
ncbi:(2Fe-2S)-binding protein [Maridesulfovibrio sp.]|uniref:(2Fe-2S)-binding protein n=1 Tax=Maridesulfovibrio sp. TaxID=2795000 RepID=UPI0029CA1ED3|nr:(2Fe-2S)-binding protein [Maridesulfovibrio sp.]